MTERTGCTVACRAGVGPAYQVRMIAATRAILAFFASDRNANPALAQYASIVTIEDAANRSTFGPNFGKYRLGPWPNCALQVT